MSVFPLRADGKVIIVTGGYGHLGKAIVESLSFHGANVIVAGSTRDKFENVFPESHGINFIEVDISETNSIKIALQKTFDQYSKIDAIINNAFYSKGQSPEELTDEDWSYGIDGTLSSVFKSIREIIPYFKKQGQGKIINVSSMYGLVAPDFSIYNDAEEFLNPPHYGAAKAGVLQLTRYYASYLGKYNIQVNSVTPGPFPSDAVQSKRNFIEDLESRTCLNRIGTPEDIAGVFTFLLSDAANFITGQNFIVDGGWTVK